MKTPWKERIKANLDKKDRERNQNKLDFYKRLYGKSKKYAFPPKEKINLQKHFYFPKSIVTEYHLSKIALAVYPVMCLKADFVDDKWFQIPQEEIAVKSGMSINTVHKALLELKNNDLLKIEKRNSGRRHFYVYKVQFIRRDMIEDYKGEYFTFNQSIVDSGTWADLHLRSKTLYLAFREQGYFDGDCYSLDDEFRDSLINYYDTITNENFPGYRYRIYDICTTPLSQLCKLVGIDSSNLTQVLEQLEKHRLIKNFFYDTFEVYLKPKIK